MANETEVRRLVNNLLQNESAQTYVLGTAGAFDANGVADAVVLDADQDTTISAPNDDQIDIEVAGADDFTITANSFNVLAGSKIDLADSCTVTWGTGDDVTATFDGTDFILNNGGGTIQLQWGGVGGLEFDDAAITGFAGAADTAGKDIFAETQDGGTASADTAGVAGGTLSIKAGDGSAGGAHTSNNPAGGAGGSIVLTPGSGGAAGSGGSGAAGADGVILERGLVLTEQGAQSAKTTDATLTAAELLSRIITVVNGAAGTTTLTLPLATALDTALPDAAAGDSFEFSVINISTVDAEDASVATNTGWTLVGNMDLPAYSAAGSLNSSGLFRARKTGAGAWTLYRLA